MRSVLPALPLSPPPDATARAFLDALAAGGFSGDIEAHEGARVAASTDNSVYQLMPQAVILPRTAGDVALALRLLDEPAFETVSLTPRGGGTGTNGQSLTTGIVLDLSRHMRSIVDIDPVARTARVQPGVVLDELNDAVRPHGLFFAPTVSPSNRATLGGMIGTDASGKGSRIHGKTSQHLLALDTVLVGGTRWTCEPLARPQWEAMERTPGPLGRVHTVVRDVVTRQREEIHRVFPRMSRFMTGYNLAMVEVGDEALSLIPLLAGSEGTLGVVVEATVRLLPIPKAQALVVVAYGSFEDALSDAGVLAGFGPSAVETLDERVLGLAQGDVVWHRVEPILTRATPPPQAPAGRAIRAINLVEFCGDDEGAVRAAAERVVQGVRAGDGRGKGATLAQDARETDALWALRKKGVGLLGNLPGPRQPVSFMEDTAVPPERLESYVKDLRALLDQEGLTYGMFGHVDVGCLHVRPALDLKDPSQRETLARVSDAVADLVQQHGGLMWGEHGKGFRSHYNPQFFGPTLYAELERVKAAFDPRGQLNPGKIASPAANLGPKVNARGGAPAPPTGDRGTPTTASQPEPPPVQAGAHGLVRVDGPMRGALESVIPAPAREAFRGALACNGNGGCFDVHPDHIMCPSYKGSRDRVHSPKGRASLLRRWLQESARRGYDPATAAPARAPWVRARLALARLLRGRGRRGLDGAPARDLSLAVYDAMDGCLACKACATQCPIHVDVPTMRAAFLERFHERYRRPLSDHLVARLEGLLPWLARWPRLFNALTAARPSRWALARIAGLVDTPALSAPPLPKRLHDRPVLSHPPQGVQRPVILIQDAFTSFYEARVVVALVDLLDRLGWSVYVAPYFPNGKGSHVKGFLRRFERTARAGAQRLRALAETGAPLVTIEPAVALTYRDEYRALLGESASVEVLLPQELLAADAQRLRGFAPSTPSAGAPPQGPPWRLFGHCTERALAPQADQQWVTVFRALGAALEPVDVGCCGMSGAFGHERRHLAESRAIYDLSWGRVLPSDRDAQARVLATGHSCRHQVRRFEGFTPLHPAEALLLHLGGPLPTHA